MNPLHCWALLVTACERGNWEDAALAALDLRNWHRNGGFLPEEIPASVWSRGALSGFAAICNALACKE